MPNPQSQRNNLPHGGQQQAHGQNNKTVHPIDAPYNFVPLASTVVAPDWADLVSHDLPFQDGLCGEIDFTLTAHSPLLVGGEQTKAADLIPGEIKPFKTPDDRYAIPGSSLKGMLRSVLEIATFSRLHFADDKRYGLRDISGPHVATSYAERVRNQVQTGFLRLSNKGEPEIVPCGMARLNHRDLETWWQEAKPIFTKQRNKSVNLKYARWYELCKKHRIADPFSVSIQLQGNIINSFGSGDITGFPVLTGQISDSSDDKVDRNGKWTHGKYRDFIFYAPRTEEKFAIHSIDPAAWRDFLFIHGDEGGKPGSNMSWPGFWKERFWNKQNVPVFYISSPKRLQIGLAYMPKLAGDFSIHDMIGHTSPEHLNAQTTDLATLIFGKIDDTPNGSLKSRVWCELATAIGTPVLQPPEAAILGSPHPTYFPNYIQQSVNPNTWELNGKDAQYATYLNTEQHSRPELRGWKRYPSRPDTEIEVQGPSDDKQERNAKIQMRLHALPPQTQFSGRISFHNLRPMELGALLWVLDFGGNVACRHGLGLAKSFGFGQVTIKLNENATLISNDMNSKPLSFAAYVQAFKRFMDQQLGTTWEQTPQIRSLLAMADPAQRKDFPGKLQHMALAMHGTNGFNDAKRNGLALASYVAISKTPPAVHHVAPMKKKVVEATSVVATIAKEQEIWPGVKLKLTPNDGVISTLGAQRAASVREDKGRLLDGLSKAKIALLQKGEITGTVTVDPCGNGWRIVDITW